MTTSFLIPFSIALTTAFWAYHSREEIVSLFSTIIAVISLLVSIVLAPWIAQILILVTALAGLRYFCDRHSCHDSKRNK